MIQHIDRFPTEPEVLYPLLAKQLAALTQGTGNTVANLANASALLAMALADINWVGFYLAQGDKLILGPFQGRPACVEIPFGRGVCGTAARENRIVLVPEVCRFPGHIPCDSRSRSEIVIPLTKHDRVAAVLDIDSPTPGRFGPADQAGLCQLVPTLEGLL